MGRRNSAKGGTYRIGITADVMEDGSFAFFSNGLRQNVLFLCRMFDASPRCCEVLLLINRPALELPPTFGFSKVKVELVNDLAKGLEIDFLLIAGTAMDPSAVKMLRSKGVRTIFYKAGNAAIISIESTISENPDKDGERYLDYDCFDEIWMTPQHEHTYKGWCETIYNCAVKIVPQIWDPSFIDTKPLKVLENFGYKPGKRSWKLGILDPNITVMKTSHFPAMVCEHAYRLVPDRIEAIYITNSIQFADHAHFRGFVRTLESYKAGKMTVEGRFVTWDFLAHFADAVVTHHWENGLNYLYYEVLFGNYPLIHNSEFLRDYGYYYETFEPESGAAALVRALENHDTTLADYKVKVSSLLASLSPLAPANIRLHEALLFGESASQANA
jgi:Protein of unknown function (DUF2827)